MDYAIIASSLRRAVSVLTACLLLDDYVRVCILGSRQRLDVTTDTTFALGCFLLALSTNLARSH